MGAWTPLARKPAVLGGVTGSKDERPPAAAAEAGATVRGGRQQVGVPGHLPPSPSTDPLTCNV